MRRPIASPIHITTRTFVLKIFAAEMKQPDLYRDRAIHSLRVGGANQPRRSTTLWAVSCAAGGTGTASRDWTGGAGFWLEPYQSPTKMINPMVKTGQNQDLFLRGGAVVM